MKTKRVLPITVWMTALSLCLPPAPASAESAQEIKPVPFREAQAGPAAIPEMVRAYIRRRVVPLEAKYFKPGFGLDPQTGMPYDHVRIRLYRGILGETGNYTAASKLSLSIPFLLGVIQQKPEFLNSGMPPAEAEDLLKRTLATLETYVAEYPDYGGFLPWVDIRPNGTIGPANTKMPSLDNGQLTWALAAVTAAFEESGEPRLRAISESAQRLLNVQNYKLFYDRKRRMLHGTIQKVSRKGRREGRWEGDKTYHLDDMFEGTLAVLWGVLHGQIPEDAWYNLRIPTVDYAAANGEKVTTFKGFRASFHEHWALGYLPFMESALAPLYRNFLYVQADYARRHQLPGFLSTAYDAHGCYRQMGVPDIAGQPVDRGDVAVVFATAMAMLISPSAGAVWLHNLYEFEGVLSEYGALESVGRDGYADIFTADAKGMTLLAVTGGVVDEVRNYLRARTVPHTSVSMYVKFLELVHAKYKQMELERDGEPIYLPATPYPAPSARILKVRPFTPPPDPGPVYDISRHLQKGHLHGKNVRSINLKTMEDDIRAGRPFQFDFEIPAYYPYFDQWAFRGTYVDQVAGIHKMNFLSVKLPVNCDPVLFEIELKSDDITLLGVRIDAAESGVLSKDGKWKTIVKPIEPAPDAQFKALNYFAVAIHDPRYLIGRFALYSRSGRVRLADIRLTEKHPVTGETVTRAANPDPDPANPLLFDLMPYWRLSHGYLDVLAPEEQPGAGYRFRGSGWRGGYTPYVDLSNYQYLYLRLGNVTELRNQIHIELKHEDEYLPGYKIPILLPDDKEWHMFRVPLPGKAVRPLNYFAVSDPKLEFELDAVLLSDAKLTDPEIIDVEFNPLKQKYRWNTN